MLSISKASVDHRDCIELTGEPYHKDCQPMAVWKTEKKNTLKVVCVFNRLHSKKFSEPSQTMTQNQGMDTVKKFK